MVTLACDFGFMACFPTSGKRSKVLFPYNIIVVINCIWILLHKIQVLGESEGKHCGETGARRMQLKHDLNLGQTTFPKTLGKSCAHKICMEGFLKIDKRILHCLRTYLYLFLRRHIFGVYCK